MKWASLRALWPATLCTMPQSASITIGTYGLQQWEIGDLTLGKRSVRLLVDPRPLGVAPLTRMAAWNCIARTS